MKTALSPSSFIEEKWLITPWNPAHDYAKYEHMKVHEGYIKVTC